MRNERRNEEFLQIGVGFLVAVCAIVTAPASVSVGIGLGIGFAILKAIEDVRDAEDEAKG